MSTGTGQVHFPSGQFYANAAWIVLAALAHNLTRWTELLGLPQPRDQRPAHAAPSAVRTPRLPGPPRRALGSAAAARRPWQTDFTEALTRLRALPAAA